MRAADSSLAVAAFASWHERHEPARKALDGGLRLIEHCALETYSVLTRLPSPHRSPGNLIRDFLAARFPDSHLRLGVAEFLATTEEFETVGEERHARVGGDGLGRERAPAVGREPGGDSRGRCSPDWRTRANRHL